MIIFILSALLAIAGANEVKPSTKPPPKKFYVCPPDFFRLGNKCYFFSKSVVKWDDAFFSCNDMNSTLAVIGSKYQHKLLRNLLSSSSFAERWIGGRFDWTKHEWLWGASGKPIDYNGFPTPPPTNATELDSFQWHCIILDPKMKYGWNHRSCYEPKHYICQLRLKTVNRKQKMKLKKLYNNRKLNEVPVPEITSNSISVSNSNQVTSNTNNENNDIKNASFASRPKNSRKRKGRKGKGRKKNRKPKRTHKSLNGTLQDAPFPENIANNLELIHTKVNRTVPKKIHWKTYYQGTVSPLHPRGIVEEFDFHQ